MRRTLKSAARAALSLARDARGIGRRRRPTSTAGLAALGRCAEPVLLLHGFLSSSRTVRLLERRIRRTGRAVHALDLPMTWWGIEELAARVAGEIAGLHARCPQLRPLTIVGHSQGGLVAAWYVKKLEGHRRVRSLITMGTPHHGTPLARAGLPIRPLARCLPQMTPGSAFLRRLHEGAWPESVRVVSIYSQQDWVVPASGAVLDTSAGPHLRNVRVDGSHFDFLTEPAVHDVVLRELGARGAAAAPSGLTGGAPAALGPAAMAA